MLHDPWIAPQTVKTKLDVDMWVRRLRNVLKAEGAEADVPQSDLFD